MPKERINRDINPPDAAKQDAGPMLPLVDNERLARRFAHFERRAVAWKRCYMVAGTSCLVCSSMAVGVLAYHLTIQQILGPSPALSGAGTVFGSVGFFCALYLLIWRPKEQWLLARFGAEWLRCAKCRLFLVLAGLQRVSDLKHRVDSQTTNVLNRFSLLVDHGPAAMREFAPGATLAEAILALDAPARPDWLADAKRAYLRNRIEIQLHHFSARIDDRRAHLRPLHSVLDWVFFAALALSLFQVGCEAFALLARAAYPPLPPAAQSVLAFATLLLFSLGTAALIWERARNLEGDADRYRYFRDEIKSEGALLGQSDLPGFMEIVARVERACLEELSDFCRDSSRSNFGF